MNQPPYTYFRLVSCNMNAYILIYPDLYHPGNTLLSFYFLGIAVQGTCPCNSWRSDASELLRIWWPITVATTVKKIALLTGSLRFLILQVPYTTCLLGSTHDRDTYRLVFHRMGKRDIFNGSDGQIHGILVEPMAIDIPFASLTFWQLFKFYSEFPWYWFI